MRGGVPNHPLRVLFPKDDARFRIGAIFEPVINRSINTLTHVLKEQTFIDMTRRFFIPYNSLLPGEIVAPDNPILKLPHLSSQFLAQVLSKIEGIAEVKITGNLQGRKRDLQLISLEHATMTMMKTINPNGMFLQHQSIEITKFYDPIEKLTAIGQLRTACAAQRDDLKSDCEGFRDDILSHELDFADPSYSQEERDKLRAMIDSTKRDIDGTNNWLDALELLCDALSFGMALIMLGKEMAIDEHTYEDHWAHFLPIVYRGAWDYYRSVPDVVRKID
jgi:hypothetical protein